MQRYTQQQIPLTKVWEHSYMISYAVREITLFTAAMRMYASGKIFTEAAAILSCETAVMEWKTSLPALVWIGLVDMRSNITHADCNNKSAVLWCMCSVWNKSFWGWGGCVSEQRCMCVRACARVSSQWLPCIGLPLSMSAGPCERTPLDYKHWRPMGQWIRSLLCYRKSSD